MKPLSVFLLLLCNAWVLLDAAAPTRKPTPSPTSAPTRTPTRIPTVRPSVKPTARPSNKPTAAPSTAAPTCIPTRPPTTQPSNPSAEPTAAPTNPTVNPTTVLTQAPTVVRTSVPTTFDQQLFAVLDATCCAEALYYGPQAVTEAGSADSQHSCFLSTGTPAKDVPHTEWLQIVTTDGTDELFRIQWTFDTAKTLAQRFADAVAVGEYVHYTIDYISTGTSHHMDGTWRFSTTSGITTSTFDVPQTTCCFSADEGAWSALNSTLWGVGSWLGGDDNSECGYVWENHLPTYYAGLKTYMYYFAIVPTAVPTTAPTFMPSIPTTNPTTTPTTIPTTTDPTAAPTITTTTAPTFTTTTSPTYKPSTTSPTTRPTTVVPTRTPTREPTATPSVDGEQQLFAVVGGNSCAENLYYGPQYITQSGSEDGKYPYFLSTNTLSNAVEHTNWLQVVTSDGVNELFRIYWSFRSAKTLAQRFASAVNGNEIVDYRIVTSTGETYYKTGTWRFSNSAQLYTTKFSVSTTTCCFSYDDGAWGAGSGTVDANGSGYSAAQFWGIGNWDSSDSYCRYVYRNGVVDTTVTNTKMYMYYFAPVPPSAEPTTEPTAPSKIPTTTPTRNPTREPTTKPTSTNPTTRPTLLPTATPTKPPTSLPTPSPSVNGDQQLFAIVGGNTASAKCSNSLIFGPQAITEAGSADGVYPYFFSTATASKNIPHTNWAQIVTSDRSSGSVELFRIYWSFRTAKTLADRFVYATTNGEIVDYRIEVVATNETLYKTGTWKYSSYASISNKFLLQYTACCLSGNYGVWGAGVNTLDGYGYNNVNNQFWGVGNYYSSDNYACNKVYKNGVIDPSIDNVKVYMYYLAPSPPTATPTTTPTKLPTSLPTTKPTTAPSAVATLPGVDAKYEQFATLTGTNCAQSLFYGPSAVSIKGQVGGTNTAYLSTNTPYKDLPHTEWLQIVTSDGSTELFRIYWTFATPRTLKDHFVYAVNSGESVSYRVVKADGTEYNYNGVWRFSSQAGNMNTKFAATATYSSFSSSYGMWGGGNGALDGNGLYNQVYTSSYWGVGNIGNSDYYQCIYVYQKGTSTYLPYQKTYMYYSTETKPTTVPTPSPSRFDYTLFAVVGGDSCTESLYYGPSAITTSGGDGHEYYLSTGTNGKNTLHTEWLQIVTSDGDNELFRIYWTFAVPRTLENHFLFAVYYGENVNYRVVVANSSEEYTYSGVWRFSDAAGLTTNKFATTTTQLGFSVDDGAWGGGSTVINANGNEIGYTYINYWGIGNWNALDDTCSVVYMNGVAYTQYNAKTYMYYAAITTPTTPPTTPPGVPSVVPTRAPTLAPTTRPTNTPTLAPTRYPTTIPSTKPTTIPTTRTPSLAPTPRPVPPIGTNDVLFAIVGGNTCAESLPYGPSAITTSGTTDNIYQYYLSTNTVAKDTLHTEWLQVVTSDGSTELFRIYWSFATPRTLKDHFVYAVSVGESVSYRVVKADGTEYYYSGVWRFSDGAYNLDTKFDTTYTQSGFSFDDGVWGAGRGVINPNSNPSGYQNTQFWGVGNWDTGDYGCNYVYMNGAAYTYGTNKVYMYYTSIPVPSKSPTSAPSRPTTNPTTVPTLVPTTTKPAAVPSATPTTFPTNALPPVSNMFAVLGGNSCAETLYYGVQPVTTRGTPDLLYSSYMSTTTGSTPHNNWIQVVTIDGTNELFRVYWTFSSMKNVANRIADAVTSGEYVSYRVETSSGGVYTYNGMWRFSDAANFWALKFDPQATMCCLSSDDGAWGAGSGTINANGNPTAYATTNFWGVGNWDAGDSDCYRIYQNGVLYTGSTIATRVYMYYNTITQATLAPVTNPTRMPVAPTRKPTTAPTYYTAPELFAVVGGSSCAETLYYGPQYITRSGSNDGQHPYFLSTSTASRNTAHSYWMQVVTSDGINELFRVYWTFNTPRTLANRFYNAVMYGESVTYSVVTSSGAQYTYYGTWRFSYRSQITLNTFSTAYTTTPFSADSGVWGGASGYVDGNYIPSDFWGIGNFGSYDGYECYKVYQNGVASSAYGTGVKVYMYTSALPIEPEPTQAPTMAPAVVSLQAQQQVDGVSVDAYIANEAAFNAVFTVTIADAVGVSTESVKDLAVLINQSSRGGGSASGTVSGSVSGDKVHGGVGGGDRRLSEDESPDSSVEGVVSTFDAERHLDSHPTTPTTPTTAATTTTATTSNLRTTIDANTNTNTNANTIANTDTNTSTNTNTNTNTNTKTTTSSDYLTIQYTIVVPASSGVTYNQLSSQLTTSVQNNQFSSLLQQHAADQNVPELTTATSGRVETEDTTPADPSAEKSSKSTIFTVPVMVGIGIGGCAVFVVLIYLFARLWFRRADGGEEGLPRLDTLQNQASAPPLAADPALSKDINAYFYGDSSHHNNNGSSSPTGGNNQIVPHDHQEYHSNHDNEGSGGDDSGGIGGIGGIGGSGVSSHMSAHRPHAAHSGTSGVGTGDIELQLRSPSHTNTNNNTNNTNNNTNNNNYTNTNTSHVTKSASAPLSPVAQPLPVAALAVPVSHMVNYSDIAIAEVYIGEAEEYKE